MPLGQYQQKYRQRLTEIVFNSRNCIKNESDSTDFRSPLHTANKANDTAINKIYHADIFGGVSSASHCTTIKSSLELHLPIY